MFCPNCGNYVNDGNKFCSKCGMKLDNYSSAPNNAAPEEPYYDDNYYNYENEYYTSPQQPAQTKKAPWLGIIIGLACAAAAVLVLLFVLPHFGINLFSSNDSSVQADIDPQGSLDEPVVTVTPDDISSSSSDADQEEPVSEIEEIKTVFSGYDEVFEQVDSVRSGKLIFESMDVSEYPIVKLYLRYADDYGDVIELDIPSAGIREAISGGGSQERDVISVEQIEGSQGMNIEFLLDKSGSVSDFFSQFQNMMLSFINSLDYEAGDRAEIISFDSYLMYMCTFTDNVDLLQNGISNMTPYGQTCLYDALYQGITNAAAQGGARCVIAFTDGEDNASIHTVEEVINHALNLQVPVYIIGTSGANSTVLNNIADATSGQCWMINDISSLESILQDIYADMQGMYCITYESDSNADPYSSRDISIALTDAYCGNSVDAGAVTPTQRLEVADHDSRYEIYAADISWTGANAACAERGGHLATITSQEEMDALVAMAEEAGLKYIWLGGYTSVRDDYAYGHWITGEDFSYTAWYPGEPSRNDSMDGEPEFYLMLWKVGDEWSWNDQRNDVVNIPGLDYFAGKVGYICEYED